MQTAQRIIHSNQSIIVCLNCRSIISEEKNIHQNVIWIVAMYVRTYVHMVFPNAI